MSQTFLSLCWIRRSPSRLLKLGYLSAFGSTCIHSGVFRWFICFLLYSFVFLENPPVHTLVLSWSLPPILPALSKPPFEPLAQALFYYLMLKTIFLIDIVSGQRRSMLHALTIDPGHIRWESAGIYLISKARFIALRTNPNLLAPLRSSFWPCPLTLLFERTQFGAHFAHCCAILLIFSPLRTIMPPNPLWPDGS